MSASHSSKPAKPYPAFPLTPHAGAGQWCKKIRGRIYYFGKLDDPDAALRKYAEQKDALHAGREPQDAEVLDMKTLVNRFLNAKQERVDSGELSPRSWRDYKEACDLLVSHFGKHRRVDDLRPTDFAGLRAKMAERWGPVRMGAVIQFCRMVFKFAYDDRLIERPVHFGASFQKPTRKTLRKHKADLGPRTFTPDEIRRALDAAGQPVRAMILLGVNCGLGNSDIGNLPQSALDLDRGMLDYPRPKTGMPRRCPLWPETAQAVRKAIALRPQPKDPKNTGLCFLTKKGLHYAPPTGTNAVSFEFAQLLKSLGINGKRGFYTLRHTFRTVADCARDQPAADFVMGHGVSHMSSHYREWIDDSRLQAVVDHVRTWLFGAVEEGGPSHA